MIFPRFPRPLLSSKWASPFEIAPVPREGEIPAEPYPAAAQPELRSPFRFGVQLLPPPVTSLESPVTSLAKCAFNYTAPNGVVRV